jgi:hypothetical protein
MITSRFVSEQKEAPPVRIPRIAVAALLAAASLAVATPAQAAAASELTITVYDPQGFGLSWRLTCDPDGGLHPDPYAACDKLREIDGDLEQIREPSGPCVRIWDPRDAEIHGYWNGEPVDFSQRYPNPYCMASAAAPIIPDQRD